MIPVPVITPWHQDADVTLYHGDALETLRRLPDASVQCVVSSPPFWGLRDYGVDEQIGLEDTPDAWCARLVNVYRECRRVLRDDGVMFLEIGDSYASSPPGIQTAERYAKSTITHPPGLQGGVLNAATAGKKDTTRVPGIKPKDLVGAPWLLAFALRADGWYLRADCIWSRPNPMPESVSDRPTKAHSYVFVLTKRARYFWDADNVREPATRAGDVAGGSRMGVDEFGVNGGWQNGVVPAGRNLRSVWEIATEPTPWAHFATFPQRLVERCIRAATSEHGACSVCGAPWRRITESELVKSPKHGAGSVVRGRAEGTDVNGWAGEAMPRLNRSVTTVGWEPSCECNGSFVIEERLEPGDCGEADEIVRVRVYRPSIALDHHPIEPCVVLDPFMGSGTTALVARRLGRQAIGIELNAEYLDITRQRLALPDEDGAVTINGHAQLALLDTPTPSGGVQ